MELRQEFVGRGQAAAAASGDAPKASRLAQNNAPSAMPSPMASPAERLDACMIRSPSRLTWCAFSTGAGVWQ